MAELAKLVIDLLMMLWPFRKVQPWQRGVYIWFGRWTSDVRSGTWPVIPYFTEIFAVSVVPEVYTTPLQTITIRGGKTLAFSASVKVRVTNAVAAYTTLGHWAETVVELTSAVLARELADAQHERFDPARGKLGRLIDELRDAVNEEIKPYGLDVMSLSMTNFVVGVRAYRLLVDRATLNSEVVT